MHLANLHRHEMRNPLSAIMLCADGIASSILDFQALQEKADTLSQDLLESNLDAAQTIVLCAQHQKRIIDDVLTLSKLNSTMLHVTPVQVQVESTVRRTLKMFESELQAHDIQMTFVVEDSYEEAKVDWVFCDPVRLTQIFINLLTNVSPGCLTVK
jgi:signal transduction histidine kinase